MSVAIGAAPKSSKRTKVSKKGNLTANGTEQVLVEFEGEGKLSGTVDVHEMTLEDKIIIRQYMKPLSTSDYQLYAKENYESIQEMPLIYFPEKLTDTAIKITLEQTQGIFRRYRHTSIMEN